MYRNQRLFFILCLSIASLNLSAQKNSSKLNIDLYRHWQAALNQEAKAAETIELLIQGETTQVKKLVEANGGFFKYAVADIASVSLPYVAIGKFIEKPYVKRMEAYWVKPAELFYEDTAMVNNNKLLPAHNGDGILPYGFKGEGAIVGIIDDGNEWKHPDFWNPQDSSTRFLYLWDQTQINPNFYESFYAYGSSWTKAQIDTGGITHNPGIHGSHVLGSAAGNALASGKYVGIAPEADLISVALRENGNFLPAFVDGVHFIFNKAAALGKPCAINSSVGTYYGSHDGTDLYTRLLEAMLDEAPGRALIQAGGNARQRKMHWQADLQSGTVDTARVWLEYINGNPYVYASFFADTADLQNINFSFELIDRTTQNIKGYTRSYNILNDFHFVGGLPAEFIDTLFYVGNQPVLLYLSAEQWAGYYEVQFQFYTPTLSTFDYWQLTASGTGKLDMWSNLMEMGSSNLVLNGSTPYYRNPDNMQTIVSGWTCSDKIITVAAYQNRNWLENYNGDTISLAVAGYPKWGIASFSSLGPTRDGRQKPDICAPGGRIMSAAPITLLNSYRNNNFTQLDKDGWHIQNSGTSMSAPMVTGAAALYFQCRPNATYNDVKQALIQSARLDSFVFVESNNIPNIHWGYGKLDVFELLKSCLVYGCTDSSAINYNSAAHLEDGSCLQIVGLELKQNIDWRLMPNPAKSTVWIELNGELVLEKLEVVCYNVLGQEMRRKKVSTRIAEFDLSELATGLYTVVLYQSGNRIGSEKLVVE